MGGLGHNGELSVSVAAHKPEVGRVEGKERERETKMSMLEQVKI